jgi:CopG family nickel-responsive transcriptional regulator
MERITISLDESLAQEFDALIRTRGYGNRSEAVRDMIRAELEKARLETAQAPHCVACLSYVYDHHERRLAERLTEMQHAAHDLVVSSMHVHLDHDNCLETLFLRGHTSEVRALGEKLAAERGVRHGQLNLVQVEEDHASHHHHHRLISGHLHSRPKT